MVPSEKYPIRLFVRGEPYRLLFFPTDVHLCGVDPPGRIFLMGTDPFGRDLLSRTLIAGRFSLFVRLLAVAVALPVGTLYGLYGAVAGYFGGRADKLLIGCARDEKGLRRYCRSDEKAVM